MDVRQLIKDNYAIYNDDCMNVWQSLPDNSVHFTIYSPPFPTVAGGLYRYSSSELDISNSRTYGQFITHYDFIVREIARTTPSGRLSAVHCMDVPQSNSGHGDNLIGFPADIMELHCMCRDETCNAGYWEKKHGLCGHGLFGFASHHTIWKEPLTVRNRTLAKRLNHSTIVDDSSKSGVAGADYLLVFRRAGENEEPIAHPYGLTEYYGATKLPADVLKYRGWQGNQIENKYSQHVWRRYASSVWDDVRIDYTLPYEGGTDSEKDEKHVHPLQLDVIARAIVLYSNPGETVGTPFMGVGSEVYQAVRMGRRAVGAELKDTYFRQAVRNMEKVTMELELPPVTLFDFAAMQAS